MFEEAQLYSPVTTDENGQVTVHLIEGHPGQDDPEYRQRRNEIAAAALAWKPGEPTPHIDYSETEHEVWRTVCEHLAPLHDRYACKAFRDAVTALDLPRDHVPQLDEVSKGLGSLTGFSYVPAPGIVPLEEFYGSLEDGIFHSTQYLRHHAAPLYTPEPDILHEVMGHGNLLADPQVAELNRLAGSAARRVSTEKALKVMADVFWFTIEFGVLWEDGELRTHGAGILSSYGEIEEFRSMEIRPLDFAAMATIDYDITHYQPVLFAAESFAHMVDSVGSFFEACDDETPEKLGVR
ncbi:MAG TPA: phenylalanine 4-monooxygenase [Marmoricola sp.]|nr:phenylalanine 4-monooxygenase [Marmoricola sp.]